ncbi:MAG: DUF2062 domain-containing protein [Myxococcales bacterium]|nr:DUF2062 domain-containing protein [Myxococcales bacterium]
MAPARKRQKTFRVRLRRFLLWLIRLRGSPHAIAGGFAIGTGVAFTPTIGLQGLIALGLATLLGANRPVAILLTWSTNPVTIPPVFGFTYYLGSFFWSGPEVASVVRSMGDAARSLASLDAFAIREQFGLFMLLGTDVFIAMWIGGLIVGVIGAAIAYPLVLRAVVKLRDRRHRRRKKRAARRRAARVVPSAASESAR